MKFDSSCYLKWMDAQNPLLQGADIYLTQVCAVFAKDESEQITGFTAFETKDFNETFLKKFEARRSRIENSKCKYMLFIPEFLKHRSDMFFKNEKFKDVEVIQTPFLNIKCRGGRFTLRHKVRIVSVDDSPVLLKFLKRAMDELGFIDVVAQSSDPLQALNVIEKFKPDLVTLDIQMPKKTGVEVMKDLHLKEHAPVLMISSLDMEEGSLVFEALNSGAFDYIQKPKLESLKEFKEELSEKILLAIEGKEKRPILHKIRSQVPDHSVKSYPDNLIWCLGASTGGTQALTSVFTMLPAHIPPTLIVQHIPPVFSKAFADSLNQLCPFTVKEAEHGEIIKFDHVYIAPGGIQMGVERNQGQLRICLADAPPVNRFKPSVDYMFSTVALLQGLKITAGVLTGMGKDGADGLLRLRKIGAQTFAQDEKSSAVYGMPRMALEMGGTDRVVSLENIAQTLLTPGSATYRKAV